MKTRLTLLLVCFVSAVSAQKLSKPKLIIPVPKTVISLNDGPAAKAYLRDMYLKSLRPNLQTGDFEKMPNGFNGPLPMPKYKGNNGKGFDVYESTLDNMPLLVPDSTNRENGYRGPKFEMFFQHLK